MKNLSPKKELEQLVNHPERKEILFPEDRLVKMRRKLSPIVYEWDTRRGTHLSVLLNFRSWWKTQILSGDKSSFTSLMECGGSESLFFCFRQALIQPRFLSLLKKWLDFRGYEQGLTEIGIHFDGEDFNGKAALELFRPILPAVRKLAVRRENALRYVAVRMLVHDHDDVSLRILWQGFRDTYSLVREIVCRYFSGSDRERIYNELFRIMISDPVRRVRISARDRISSDFSDLYKINPAGLSDYERVHALEHLDSRLASDENAALDFLLSENREERLTAAHFLERTGTLKRLLCQADLGDRGGVERIVKLLSCAVDVGICHFLDVLPGKKESGVLFAGLRLLENGGPQNLMAPVLKTVFELDISRPETQELILLAALVINKKGDQDCFQVMRDAMERHAGNKNIVEVLLDNLPTAGAAWFREILFSWLKNPEITNRGQLEKILSGYSPSLVLDDCYSLLHEMEKLDPAVRKSALKILAATGETCIMQNVLENLTLIPPVEVPPLVTGMKKLAGKRYDELLTRLLETRDTELRCTLINLLPETGSAEHLKFLDDALEDPDTLVRVSVAQAISRMNDKVRLKNALVLLHDTEPEVRVGTAYHFATVGQEPAMTAIRDLLLGEQELHAVKISAIEGLARAGGPAALEILMEQITEPDDVGEAVINSMTHCSDPAAISWLTEYFGKALPPVRERLVEVFVKMGERSEQGLVELLRKKDKVLSVPLSEILTRTGFIPVMADRLKSPLPEERLMAAQDLMAVGTAEALRYAVIALRDVKKDIRVAVLNGLKSGHTASGQSLKAVIDMMANDPDQETRKLAAWTIQRLKA